MTDTEKTNEAPKGPSASKAMLDFLVFISFIACFGGLLFQGNYVAAWFAFTTAFYYLMWVLEIKSNALFGGERLQTISARWGKGTDR